MWLTEACLELIPLSPKKTDYLVKVKLPLIYKKNRIACQSYLVKDRLSIFKQKGWPWLSVKGSKHPRKVLVQDLLLASNFLLYIQKRAHLYTYPVRLSAWMLVVSSALLNCVNHMSGLLSSLFLEHGRNLYLLQLELYVIYSNNICWYLMLNFQRTMEQDIYN